MYYKWIKKRGIKYHINDLLASSFKNNNPVFSIIKTIIIDKNDKINFLLQEFKTVSYINYLASYNLEETESMCKILTFENLKNKWPLDLYEHENSIKLVTAKIPLK